LPIADLSGWELAGWFLIWMLIAVVLFLAWVLIEEARHNRRLRKAQRQTMEARQRAAGDVVLSDRKSALELPARDGKPVRPRFLS
jgi:cyanate permease